MQPSSSMSVRSLFSCLCRKTNRNVQGDPISAQQAVAKTISRQHTPGPSASQSTVLVNVNAGLGDNSDSPNFTTLNKNEIQKNLAIVDVQCDFLREKLEYFNEEINTSDNVDDRMWLTEQLKMAHRNLDKFEAERSRLLQQRSCQEASNGNQKLILGKFEKLISRILPEKFIEEYMSEFFNARYLNTKIASLKKKINVLSDVHEKLILDKQNLETNISGDPEMFKILKEKNRVLIDQQNLLNVKKRNKTNKLIGKVEDCINKYTVELNNALLKYRQKFKIMNISNNNGVSS